MRVERIELSASVLSGQRSTTELHTRIAFIKNNKNNIAKTWKYGNFLVQYPRLRPFLFMQNKDIRGAWWKPGITLFFQISTLIIVPIIASIYLGAYIDKIYHITPYGTGICIILALVLSYLKTKKYILRYLDSQKK